MHGTHIFSYQITLIYTSFNVKTFHNKTLTNFYLVTFNKLSVTNAYTQNFIVQLINYIDKIHNKISSKQTQMALHLSCSYNLFLISQYQDHFVPIWTKQNKEVIQDKYRACFETRCVLACSQWKPSFIKLLLFVKSICVHVYVHARVCVYPLITSGIIQYHMDLI